MIEEGDTYEELRGVELGERLLAPPGELRVVAVAEAEPLADRAPQRGRPELGEQGIVEREQGFGRAGVAVARSTAETMRWVVLGLGAASVWASRKGRSVNAKTTGSTSVRVSVQVPLRPRESGDLAANETCR